MPELLGELPLRKDELSLLIEGLDMIVGMRSGDLTNEEEAEIAELSERMIQLLAKLNRFYKRGNQSVKGRVKES